MLFVRNDVATPWLDAGHETSVVTFPHAGAKTEGILDDRSTGRRADFVAQVAMFGIAHFRVRKTAEMGHAGLIRNVTDVARLRSCAEQRSLRPAQHFDPVRV